MALLWIVFLSLDIVLMGGAYYFLSRGKKAYPTAEAEKLEERARMAEENAVRAASLVEELKKELSELRKTSTYLEKKRAQFDVFEGSLHEKGARLDELIRNAEESAVRIELTEADIVEDGHEVDRYSKAAKLVSSGAPVEKIAQDLGLLNGEARLLSSLNAYRQ